MNVVAGLIEKLHPSSRLLEAYRQMLLARVVDEKAIVLYKQNKCLFQIGCAGHEAVQVAAAHNLKVGLDWAYPYYRDMAFCVAMGISPREILLGCLNKAEDPASGGRQMPMHYGHPNLNIPSQSSPTGTQFLQAVGAALSLKRRSAESEHEQGVVYVSAGEGTTAQGAYHEALNWAARELLPIVFLIQNNKYAISVHISEQIAGSSIVNISSGYEGLHVERINGVDYLQSYEAFEQATWRARKGEGPSVLVADVVRLQSHSISDDQLKYRSPQELAQDRERDPLLLLEQELLSRRVVEESELVRIKEQTKNQVDQDAVWAESRPDPDISTAEDFVYAGFDPSAAATEPQVPDLGEDYFMVDALNQALDEELGVDPDILVFGQDVAGGKGGVFTVTRGLTDKHGRDRVFNSPLAEASICGVAAGLATCGFRPVAEIQFGDYIWTGMMQIRNEIAMMHYRSNGAFSVPLVIRVAVGGYIRGALYHSQSIEGTFSHFPGLIVVMPSNAFDAKSLLKSAIRSSNPVLFLEHKGLYRQIFAKRRVGEELAPIGKAKVVRAGTDLTIVTWGMLVHFSYSLAGEFADEGIDIEIVDLRTLLPLDMETVLESVTKTSRVLVAHEDVGFMGLGAEIAAQIADKAFFHLDAPVRRVGAKFTPVPHAGVLEREVLPQISDLREAVFELLSF